MDKYILWYLSDNMQYSVENNTVKQHITIFNKWNVEWKQKVIETYLCLCQLHKVWKHTQTKPCSKTIQESKKMIEKKEMTGEWSVTSEHGREDAIKGK